MSKRLVTKARFQSWLNTKKPQEVVGLTVESCMCPVANFINESLGPIPHDVLRRLIFVDGIEAVVTHEGASSIHPVREIILPNWAYKFINKLDGKNAPQRSLKVSAKEALELLATV